MVLFGCAYDSVFCGWFWRLDCIDNSVVCIFGVIVYLVFCLLVKAYSLSMWFVYFDLVTVRSLLKVCE